MRIIRHPLTCPEPVKGSVLALGNFDGVHRGHRAILHTTLELAERTKKPAAVMTFEPHPASVLRLGAEPMRITPFRRKARLIGECGISTLFALHFTPAFSQLSAEDFIRNILCRALQVSHIVIGDDFHFGHKRGGNAALLEKMAAECGYGVTRLTDSTDGTGRFSSTRIREHLKAGEIAEANTLLGHDYFIEGRVLHGEKRGAALLDCPTANIVLKDEVRLRFGVYTSVVSYQLTADSKKGLSSDNYYLSSAPAITHIGLNSSFGGQKAIAETHIFDFNGDLYGKRLAVRPLKFLRPEEQFASVEELKATMENDIKQARSHFGI